MRNWTSFKFHTAEVYERMTFLSALSVFLLEMVTISGVFASWNVKYNQMDICAAEGSLADMSCDYTYPKRLTVTDAYWTIVNSPDPPNLLHNQHYKDRITANCGNRQEGRCTLVIQRVKKGDNVMYYCRITTNVYRERWIGQPGVTLKIADLQVHGAQNIMEGKSISLTCQTTCTLTGSPSFIWSKDGHPVEKKQSDQLWLYLVSYKDEGSYTCAVSADHPSPEFTLNVMYTPKETTVSVSPSGQVVEGSQVNLTCISKANPPAVYTWYKRRGENEEQIGEGKIFTFSQLVLDNAGFYSCEANNNIGDEKSSTIELNVLYAPRNTLVSINPSNQTLEGTTVTLSCSSDANPPVENYTWFKVDESTPVGSGQQYNITNIRSEDEGWYYCEARNEVGADDSTVLSITVTDRLDMWRYIYIAIAAACGVVILLCVAVLWIRRQNGHKESTRKDKLAYSQDPNEDQYANTGFQREDGTAGPPSSVAAEEAEESVQYSNLQSPGSRESGKAQGDDVQYASVQPKSSRQTAGGAEDDAQYASVQPKHSRQTAGDQRDDVQYASVKFKKATAAEGTPAQSDQEDSVIYSGVQSQHISR